MMKPTHFCEELIIDILSRLPAKSLVRFMTVCRLWKSVIISPYFKSLHLSKSTNKLLLLSSCPTAESYTCVDEENLLLSTTLSMKIDFPYKHRPSYKHTIIGSVDGLLCIHISSYEDHSIILWNPCIRKHIKLPTLTVDASRDSDCGFGATATDYKVVNIKASADGKSGRTSVAAVYSMKAGRWRNIHIDDDLYRNKTFCGPPVLLEGRLHWIVYQAMRYDFIFSFHMEDEVFEKNIVLPEKLLVSRDFWSLNVTIVKGSLGLIVKEHPAHPNRFMDISVWVMEEYGVVNSWSKLYNLDLNSLDSAVTLTLSSGDILHFLRNTLTGLGLADFPPKLVIYNHTHLSKFHEFTKYKESLVLLGQHNAVADQDVLSMFKSHSKQYGIQFPLQTGWDPSPTFNEAPVNLYYMVPAQTEWYPNRNTSSAPMPAPMNLYYTAPPQIGRCPFPNIHANPMQTQVRLYFTVLPPKILFLSHNASAAPMHTPIDLYSKLPPQIGWCPCPNIHANPMQTPVNLYSMVPYGFQVITQAQLLCRHP